MTGIIYCLENTEMPGGVKIGQTTDIEQRLHQLDNTSVPVPFVCVIALEVENHIEAERLLHDAFGDHRVRKSREPRRDPSVRCTRGRGIRSRVGGLSKTPPKVQFRNGGDHAWDGAALRASEGTGDDGEPRFIATVHSRRRILFEGEETSLTAAEIRGRLGLPQYWLSAANLWYVDGESLSDRRERMEQSDQDDD